MDQNNQQQPNYKYAHLADLHLGSWRDPTMRELSTTAFLTAIDDCINRKVDFILFSGDLFNTSLPSLDTLKIVTKKLKELNDIKIPLYVIAGSHDFSPSGKTMIDVLENAGLLINVCKGNINQETKELHLKFTTDPKTNIKITGMLGRKGMLDKTYYENLHHDNLETEPGYKIFMFHTTISELLPKELSIIDSQPLSIMPKNFNYYAGGHIHHPTNLSFPNYPNVTYTGSLFPVNFQELEKYSKGGYYIIQTNTNNPNSQNNQNVEWIPHQIVKHHHININCKTKNPENIAQEINSKIPGNCEDTIITIRLEGTLEGHTSDIPFKQIFENIYKKGAKFVMKNSARIQLKDFEEIQIGLHEPEKIEHSIILEHLQQKKTFDKETEHQLIKTLLLKATTQKKEGETLTDFQKRIEEEIKKIMDI